MASNWTISTENQKSRLSLPKNRGAFRSQMKPLIFFETLLGHTLSISRGQNSRKGSDERGFSYGNKTIACVMIAIQTSGAVCLLVRKFDDYIIHEVSVLLYFLTLKICIGSQRKLHDLIDQIDYFDRSFSETFICARVPGRNFWWGCLWVLLTLALPVSILLFFVTQVSNILKQRFGMEHFFGLCFHIVAILQRILIFVHFFAVGRAMRVRFRLTRDLLEDELQKSRPSAANLENIRIHHARHSILVDAMNASVSKRLIFPVVTTAANFLFVFYRYVYLDHFYIHPLIIANVLTHLLMLKIVASGSERIVLESRMPLYVVRATIITKLPFLCQAQILLFQDQILAVPVQISAGGFFYLDNKLLTELAVLVVTYCTVILQLVPHEDDDGKKTESDLANSTAANEAL